MSIEELKGDWRITGDEDFLLNAEVIRKKYDGDDHEHCIFCWHKFMSGPNGAPDSSSEGYVTSDGDHWICDNCFNDFKGPFGWTVKNNTDK